MPLVQLPFLTRSDRLCCKRIFCVFTSFATNPGIEIQCRRQIICLPLFATDLAGISLPGIALPNANDCVNENNSSAKKRH